MKRSKRKTKPVPFTEQYEIRYDYKKPDGYWVHSALETIDVVVDPHKNVKRNHEQAKREFLRTHPGARVTQVIYA